MKLFELTVTRKRVTIRREAEERLTGTQKFYIVLTGIVSAAVCATILGFFSMIT